MWTRLGSSRSLHGSLVGKYQAAVLVQLRWTRRRVPHPCARAGCGGQLNGVHCILYIVHCTLLDSVGAALVSSLLLYVPFAPVGGCDGLCCNVIGGKLRQRSLRFSKLYLSPISPDSALQPSAHKCLPCKTQKINKELTILCDNHAISRSICLYTSIARCRQGTLCERCTMRRASHALSANPET